jgi:hypothetical protein
MIAAMHRCAPSASQARTGTLPGVKGALALRATKAKTIKTT